MKPGPGVSVPFEVPHDLDAFERAPGPAGSLTGRGRADEFRRSGFSIGIRVEQGTPPLVQSAVGRQEHATRRTRRPDAHNPGPADTKALIDGLFASCNHCLKARTDHGDENHGPNSMSRRSGGRHRKAQ